MNDEDVARRLKSPLHDDETVDVVGILHRASRIRQRRRLVGTVALALVLALGASAFALTRHVKQIPVNSVPYPGIDATPMATPSHQSTQLVAPAGLGVTLQVPITWHIDSTYSPTVRYEGSNGFVQITQFGFRDPNKTCQDEAAGPDDIYGARPSVVTMTLAGQSACMVVASADAPATVAGGFQPSLFVVSYPQPSPLWGSVGIYADVNHIRSLAASMTVTAPTRRPG